MSEAEAWKPLHVPSATPTPLMQEMQSLYQRIKLGTTTAADRVLPQSAHAVVPPPATSVAADAGQTPTPKHLRRSVCIRHPKACRIKTPASDEQLQPQLAHRRLAVFGNAATVGGRRVVPHIATTAERAIASG